VLDELFDQGRFPDATAANESEERLIFELASGFVRTGKMVEVTFLAGGKIERAGSVFPPGVVVVEIFNEGVAGVDRHRILG
jgi:hypothetical protein